MKRYIRSAEESVSKEDILRDSIATLKDDFDFAVSGIEKLATDGDVNGAMEKVNALSSMLNSAINDIAGNIASGE